jgi:hypothetical protein
VGSRLDVDVASRSIWDVPMEAGTELKPVVDLDDLDPERPLFQ